MTAISYLPKDSDTELGDTYAHTCTPTCTHMHTHTSMWTHMYNACLRCTYAHMHIHTWTHNAHTCTDMCTHMQHTMPACTHTHKHAHTCTHMYTWVHTCTHMHTCAQHSLVKKLIFRLEQKIQANTFAFPLPRDPGRRKNILGIVLVSENKPTGHLTHLPLPPSRWQLNSACRAQAGSGAFTLPEGGSARGRLPVCIDFRSHLPFHLLVFPRTVSSPFKEEASF